jgi:ribosomal-protein-alanine N-acetyltransferase
MKKHTVTLSDIETHRYYLRKIENIDVQGIFELDSNPAVRRYLGIAPITTMDEAQSIIDYIKDQYDKYNIGRWAVIDKVSNEFVGWSGLKYETEVRDDMDYYDLGYRLLENHWGKGIATETSIAALKYGFEALKLTEIYAGARIDNIASNKVLQKVGLSQMEVFDYDGKLHNWYRITKKEWLDGQTES